MAFGNAVKLLVAIVFLLCGPSFLGFLGNGPPKGFAPSALTNEAVNESLDGPATEGGQIRDLFEGHWVGTVTFYYESRVGQSWEVDKAFGMAPLAIPNGVVAGGASGWPTATPSDLELRYQLCEVVNFTKRPHAGLRARSVQNVLELGWQPPQVIYSGKNTKVIGFDWRVRWEIVYGR